MHDPKQFWLYYSVDESLKDLKEGLVSAISLLNIVIEPRDLIKLTDVLSDHTINFLALEISLSSTSGNNLVQLIRDGLLKNSTLTHFILREGPMEDDLVSMELATVVKENRTLQTISLFNCKIGNGGVVALSKSLEYNQVLTSLNLEKNQFSTVGVERLTWALKINQTLSILFLGNNRIGPEGAECLASALEENIGLTVLNLGGNRIGDAGAGMISRSLHKNKTLKKLVLNSNQIGFEGSQYLSLAIMENQSLIEIALGNNQIGSKGVERIALALKENKSLLIMGLRRNKLGFSGAIHVALLFKKNQTLAEINLAENAIGDKGVSKLVSALQGNYALKRLELKANRIEDCGAEKLSLLLKTNTTLTYIGLNFNAINRVGLHHLATALKTNQSLNTLALEQNNLGYSDISSFTEYFLKTGNKTMTRIDFSFGGFQQVPSLDRFLMENRIQVIHLFWQAIYCFSDLLRLSNYSTKDISYWESNQNESYFSSAEEIHEVITTATSDLKCKFIRIVVSSLNDKLGKMTPLLLYKKIAECLFLRDFIHYRSLFDNIIVTVNHK